jgi:thiol-disulfide isomerase/thioredoxin
VLLLVVTPPALLAGCKDDAPRPSSSEGTQPPPSATPLPTGHLQIAEASAGGDVEPLVREALARASAMHRRLIVYVGATWCEPCQRFHRAAAQGELDASFPDLDVLAFDLDRDGERLASAGYVSKYIPLFALPSADGSASGKQVEGGVKGDGAVAYLTPRLKGLLAM